ncbi:MAG: hypothetical protein D6797_02855 [Bdellovibrio sp.]|nr:MAG: hypothetical protein D6797_02855 [Bdellovibrio sp.]
MKSVGVLFMGLWLAGCASIHGLDHWISHPLPSRKVYMQLKGLPGQTFITKYRVKTHVQEEEKGKKVRDKTDKVQFKVSEKVLQGSPFGEALVLQVSTIEKKGSMDLHELATPEFGESFLVVLSARGEVLQYGDFPRRSIFFVPSFVLPEDSVEVGDTWTSSSFWVSPHSALPLKMDVVYILKGLYECGEAFTPCAKIEVSGGVSIPGLDPQKARYYSQVQGTLLFSTQLGQMLWSSIESSEQLVRKDRRVLIHSLMNSEKLNPLTPPR